jgi:hypothetical protein
MKTLDQLWQQSAQVEPRTAITALPFTISKPGSYYLTTNLIGSAGLDGITIAANNVTVDLVGFALTGVAGSGAGIMVSDSRTNLTIRNGAVTGWGSHGIYAYDAFSSQFLELRLARNQGWGLTSGERSTIRDCTANENAYTGISANYHSLISGCMVTGNGTGGLEAGLGGTLRDCAAVNNLGDGILAGDVSTIAGCSSRDNLLNGFNLGAGCSVDDCAATANGDSGVWVDRGSTIHQVAARSNAGEGINAAENCTLGKCTSRQNGAAGILAGEGSTLNDCAAKNNGGNGLETDVGCTISSCTAHQNVSGIVAGTGGSVTGCNSRGNTDLGINAGQGCSVSGCSAFYNRIGISVTNDCYVLNNTLYGNAEGGILVSLGNNRIDGNNITATASGWGIQVNGNGNLVIRNSARQNSSGNYYTAPATTNSLGEVLNVSGATVTNANPWANFSF